ncbi:MAG: 2,3-bisphosphoglycerate-independent phosphoglycerate mutase [Deltaproteobacteria bacterium]|nr:2,3-bisphosphoglycerate-independent phosphoglycerate mutase [Deltaproteobacteria bacterium]
MKTPTLLCILDGFGLNPNTNHNAVAQARKPNFDACWNSNPHSTLTTFGERVGLPEGQMGNSEVGHLNIGAGRVVEQWLLRISRALAGSYLKDSPAYGSFRAHFSQFPALHVCGLYSDGGVHSHRDHLKLLISRLSEDYSGPIYLHLFTDGRDTAPCIAAEQIEDLTEFLKKFPRCKIASICGRFYAMDRDKRWERVKRAYDAIVSSIGTPAPDPVQALRTSYTNGVNDEFIEPLIVTPTKASPQDGYVFWNFREDRMREIVAALCTERFDGFVRTQAHAAPSHVLCFTEYDHSYHLPFLFSNLEIKNHLGEFIAGLQKTQLRVAETEKYPHVTYFLNGGIETPYAGEDRKLVPSPRDVKTYDEKPEMSARGVTEIVVEALKSRKYDLVVVNLANCDMVGHTGSLDAATKAVECVDECLGVMLSALQNVQGKAIILADHGNAEQMIDYETGAPFTSHTMYPVPVIVVGQAGVRELRGDGALCDVAPTVLKLMDLPTPPQMSGRALF